MKKIISTLMVMALLIGACVAVMAVPASADAPAGAITGITKTVYRAVTAPTVDGVITNGEYGANENLFVAGEWTNGGGDAATNLTANEVKKFYAAWTPEGLYIGLELAAAEWFSQTKCDFSTNSETNANNYVNNAYASFLTVGADGLAGWEQVWNDPNGNTGYVGNAGQKKIVYNGTTNTVTIEVMLKFGLLAESGATGLTNGLEFYMTLGAWDMTSAGGNRLVFGGNATGYFKSSDSSVGLHTWGKDGNSEGMPKFTLATQPCKDSHGADETVEAVPATCTTVGYTAGTRCSICYTTTSGCEKVEIDSTNHGDATFEDAEAVAATCTEDGHEAGKKCAACHGWVTGGAVIEATGHTIIDVEKIDATCQKKGTEAGKMCSVCGEKNTEGFEKIDKVDHNYVDGKCTMCQAVDPNPTQETEAETEAALGCSSMLGIGGIAAVVATAVSTLGIGYVSKKR